VRQWVAAAALCVRTSCVSSPTLGMFQRLKAPCGALKTQYEAEGTCIFSSLCFLFLVLGCDPRQRVAWPWGRPPDAGPSPRRSRPQAAALDILYCGAFGHVHIQLISRFLRMFRLCVSHTLSSFNSVLSSNIIHFKIGPKQ